MQDQLASRRMTTGDSPGVTVVIPTFNRGWIISEAVESVLAQDFSDFELIVVDDGSDDETPGILNRFADDITVIHQQNQGVSAARNAGVRAGSGTYVAFLDSDDLWLKGKLSHQVDFFTKNKEAMICQTGEVWIRNGVRVNPRLHHKKSSGMIFMPSLKRCMVSPSAVMMRRDLFETVGPFDERLPACEDYDLWLRVGLRFSIHLIDTPLVVKRGGHPDQLSRMPGLDRYRIQSIVNILDNMKLTTAQRQGAVEVLQKKCRIYAAGCRKRNRMGEYQYYRRLPSNYAPIE